MEAFIQIFLFFIITPSPSFPVVALWIDPPLFNVGPRARSSPQQGWATCLLFVPFKRKPAGEMSIQLMDGALDP